MAVSYAVDTWELVQEAWRAFHCQASPVVEQHRGWKIFSTTLAEVTNMGFLRCWPNHLLDPDNHSDTRADVTIDFSDFSNRKLVFGVSPYLLRGAIATSPKLESATRTVFKSLKRIAEELSAATGYNIEIRLPPKEHAKLVPS